MGHYFTVMLIPDQGRGVRSFRVPKILFRTLAFIAIVLVVLFSVFAYDYQAILKQVYENRHLTIENRQLKKQIQLFNMKINSLTEDIERIQTFEKKLRIISGIEQINMAKPLQQKEQNEQVSIEKNLNPKIDLKIIKDPEKFKKSSEFTELQELYEQKIATALGLQIGHIYTREWNKLTKRGFLLADQYAEFDYKFNILKDHIEDLEIDIHKLDQFLLDKNSFLSSTPTLLPTKGWITSYYGPRISPTSKRLKMHEGIDIGAKSGTPIIAPADGVVTYSGRKLGFGNFVQLNHGYGVETIYAHAKILSVEKGITVSRGDKLATIGSTGYSTGPHVHYEVRVHGTPVDPLFFILD